MRAFVLIGALIELSAMAGGAKGRATELWLAGLTAFNEKNYAEACPLMEKAASLSPANGALWADLGMCEAAAGHRDQAVSASLRAARYGDRKARDNAYLTLQSLGERASIPAEASELKYTCAWIPERPELDCGQRLWACTYGFGVEDGRPRPPEPSGSAVVFGVSELRRLELEGVEPSKMGYQKGAGNQLELEHEDACIAAKCGDGLSWTCERSATVKARTANCFRVKMARAPPKGDECRGVDCDILAQCFQETCDLATYASVHPASWPEVIAELKRTHEPCEACKGAASFSCEILVADPCNKRIGYLCNKGDGPPEIREMTVVEKSPPRKRRAR
jgi:hypothetical protein